MVSDWIYDAASHGIGRLQITCTSASSNPTCTSATTTKTFTYDATGRPSTTTINTDATNFTYSTTYNTTNGAIDTITYPSGLVTKAIYNAFGYLCSIADTAGSPTCTGGGGSSVFWTGNTSDAELHLLQQTAGNGVATTDTFDANTGLLTNVRSGPSNAVAQFDYSYDTIGNLTYRSDDYLGVFERFCYDNLNRLTNSATGASGVTTCTSSGSGITTKTIGYDQLGDIASKSDVGTYSYPASGSGSVLPHAVSSITGTVNGVTNPSYIYDLNGNMTGGAGITATYTAFNMAATITQGTTTIGFTYDSDHQRIKQCIGTSCATSTTYYLNDPATGGMSEQLISGSTTTWHDFLIIGGHIFGERFSVVGGSTTWNYFVLDHLGSVAVNTDATGAVTERLSYDAWGRRRNSDGTDNTTCSLTSATTRGFTGHEEMDSICGINANARIYDPTIGRFMSPDSQVQNPLDDQSLNRFSYVGNRPLSAVDPTGHFGGECCVGSLSGGGFGAGANFSNDPLDYDGVSSPFTSYNRQYTTTTSRNSDGTVSTVTLSTPNFSYLGENYGNQGQGYGMGQSYGAPSGVEVVIVTAARYVPGFAASPQSETYPLAPPVFGSSPNFQWSMQPYHNAEAGYGVLVHIKYKGKNPNDVHARG
jgi:RHS repeat-associated protein